MSSRETWEGGSFGTVVSLKFIFPSDQGVHTIRVVQFGVGQRN